MAPTVSPDIQIAGKLDPAYLEALFQGAGMAIVACDPEGAIVMSNIAASRLFGERANPGRRLTELFADSEKGAVASNLARCLAEIEPTTFRFRFGGTESDPVEYAVWLIPVLDPDGAIRGVSLWFRDITERMRLQRIVDKREKLASLGSLSGAVAHHYNNLLCCIATSVEYAINMNTMTAMRRALQRTAEAVARATAITRQLMAFAQADRRGGDLADLKECVIAYLDLHEETLNQRRIRIVEDIQSIPVIPVRRDLIGIIIGNIIENAVEAMSNGGTLTITLARRDEESVTLSIADTGGGIPPEHMEHLFEPFFTTKGELGDGAARNAGMGLAVVHGLVGELRGSIMPSNIPGRGARFDIVLPIAART